MAQGKGTIIFCLAGLIAGLLSACQLPSPSGPSLPSVPSTPSSTPSPAPVPSAPDSPASADSAPPGEEESSTTRSEQEPSAPVAGEPSDSGEEGQAAGDLDAQLDEALEDFDEAMQNPGNGAEKDTIDILSPAGASAGLEGEEPLFEEAELDEGGMPTVENEALEQRAAEGASEGVAGAAAAGQRSANADSSDPAGGAEDIIPVPEDVGDGRGDDIVMRQIRDAAMKERDPVLREKLWDEYRRIKNQQ